MLGQQAEAAGRVVKEARKMSRKPLWVKLPPDAGLEVAQAVEEEGANAVCASNTFRAMAVDIETGKPVFKQVFAGLSGPAILPITLRIVYELVDVLDIPVIGIGGITTWQDVVAFIMAGATAVQVGTANFISPTCAIDMVEGLEKFMRHRRLNNWEEIRGCAH